MPRSRFLLLAGTISTTLLLSACNDAEQSNSGTFKRTNANMIAKLIPARVGKKTERELWAADIINIMDKLEIERSLTNVCSIVAVVDQESNFKANPTVAGLGKMVERELDEKIKAKLGNLIGGKFSQMLQTKPTPENSFIIQLEQVKTEKDLDLWYRNMFDYFKSNYKVGLVTAPAGLLSGRDLTEYFNPVKTLGSMQVHVGYALDNKIDNNLNTNQVRDSMYERYGGLYYGIHRLMMYPARYEKPLYRFADYNSGMYSSRNASIQNMLAKLNQQTILLDGDLLSYNKDGEALSEETQSELAIRQVFKDNGIDISARQIRKDLLTEKTIDFEDSKSYLAIHELYAHRFGGRKNKAGAYAIMPQVKIAGPKLSRDFSTNHFASWVNNRFKKCQRIGKNLGLKDHNDGLEE